MKILVVEDDPNLLGCWVRLLEQEGHEAVLADSEGAALRELGARPFDLVVLDLFCRNGLASGVTASATQRNADCKVVMVCGSARNCAPDLFALSPSVMAVLCKPVDNEDLLDVCRKAERDGLTQPMPAPVSQSIAYRS